MSATPTAETQPRSEFTPSATAGLTPPERPHGRPRLASWRKAVEEIVLIVTGVLIALAVNNWNEDRHDRATERKLLQEMRATLTSDLNAVRQAEDELRVRERRVTSLLADLDRGRIPSDSAGGHFGAVLRVFDLTLNRSVYDVLKGKGLDLIADDSLRFAIIQLYDERYANFENAGSHDRAFVFDVVRPYYIQHFRNIRFGENATALNQDAVIRDPVFRNIVDYRLASLRANRLADIGTLESQISAMVTTLDRRLGR